MSTLPVAIIGGGVSGLHAAALLTARGVPCVVLESRPEVGGRAMSVVRDADAHGPHTAFDLGPAWFWPDAQPTITSLAQRLKLPVFPQYARGAMRVERFRLEAPQSFVPDDGTIPDAMRFAGGAQSLAAALASQLPDGSIHLSSHVTHIAQRGEQGVTLTVAGGHDLPARAVILALPLRLAASSVTFTPPLPTDLLALMRATPTWMAPHAKVLAVYPTPFWRADGYSGMVSSFVGPLQEIHDASPETGLGALFGFVGMGAGARTAIGEPALRERAIAQLVRLFGAQAATPLEVYVKDWAADPYTTIAADLEPAPLPHGPGGPLLSTRPWNGRILLAGAESSHEHPGYLEGALRAAERAVADLIE